MTKPIQSSTYVFRDLIESGYLYVDKTPTIYELIRYPKGIYFLSRPRRFGKSLLISTLTEIFRGNKELFKGLWLYESDYQWESYPVVRFDFSLYPISSADDLKQVIDLFVAEIAERYQITLRGFNYVTRFGNLIQQLSREKHVVLLIDEYDKPIIDNLLNVDEAKRVRETLKHFYTTIKALDAQLGFVFITGISRFSKVGVFSAMNHLNDITMDPRFATLLGLTEAELERDLAEYIADFATAAGVSVAEMRQKIRTWYNGYCFTEYAERVYNPFSTLQLLLKQRFHNYWFATGTPTFLINLITERQYDVRQLDQLEMTGLGLQSFDIEHLEILPLLFQTGYLTIQDYKPDFGLYRLGYPNYEVESAFLSYLLSAFDTIPVGVNEGYLRKLIEALRAEAYEQFFDVLSVFFANIPYDLHIAKEKYYQTIFYLIFRMLGVYIEVEVKTNKGRIDVVIELDDRLILFEFKLDKSAADALQQIKDNEYFQKYRLSEKSVILIGANFDSGARQVSEWVHELSG